MSNINEQFPSNSNKSKTEKRVDKVTQKGVVLNQKSTGKRLKETFFVSDTKSVFSYVIYEILIPAAKSTLLDIIVGGSEMSLFNGETGRRGRRRTGSPHTEINYTNYRARADRGRPEPRRQLSAPTPNLDNIFFESRIDADSVLEHLSMLIDEYGRASVYDLYDLIGVTGNYVDQSWGWEALGTARVAVTRGGYLLELPKTKSIK